jgi:hypothetical protein
MKKAFVALLIVATALPAFAQNRPHPRPRPNPRSAPCTVVAVDRYNRVMAHFYGRTNPGHGMCRDALRNCNYEIRRRGWWDARCLQVRGRW